jgi:uncharacterized protein YbjT (DUF2867 family)
MKYVITTPTGKIGSRVTRNLLQAGKDVTLLVRDKEKVAGFAEQGATVIEGDLEDETYVVNSTREADVLFWLTPPNYAIDDFRQYQNRLGENVAKAVRANNIEYVVNLSSTGAHLAFGNGPVNGLYDIEQRLDAVATNLTHLRPTAFYENLLGSLDTIKNAGALFLPVNGDATVPMIATSDIGDIASDVLLKLDWTGKRALHLWGPKETTHNEVAIALTGVLERKVNHVEVSDEQAHEALKGMGLTEDMTRQYIELYNSFSAGHFCSGIDQPELRGKTTFEQWARDVFRPAYSA